jgi:hypothetical protein
MGDIDVLVGQASDLKSRKEKEYKAFLEQVKRNRKADLAQCRLLRLEIADLQRSINILSHKVVLKVKPKKDVVEQHAV